MANLHQLLQTMIDKGASDLHITTGSPPQLRIDGQLVPMNLPPLSAAETKQICYSILTDVQKHKFEENDELDLSFGIKGLSRFRANVVTRERPSFSTHRRSTPTRTNGSSWRLSTASVARPHWRSPRTSATCQSARTRAPTVVPVARRVRPLRQRRFGRWLPQCWEWTVSDCRRPCWPR